MKFPSLLAAAMLPAAIIGKKDSGFKYERLDKDDAVSYTTTSHTSLLY